MDVRFLILVFTVAGLMASVVTVRIGSLSRIAQLAAAAALIPILYKFHRRIYAIIKTLPRDLKFLYRYIHIRLELKRCSKKNLTILKIFRERARLYPNKPCFIYEGKIWTNAYMNEYSNRVASVFQKAGHKKGDVVGLMMTNRPEYIGIFLGLGKLGVITSLINTNLRLQQLSHCLVIVGAKSLIYTDEFSSAIDDIADSVQGIVKYKQGGTANGDVRNFDQLLAKADTSEPVVDNEPGFKDPFLYIYTSGTTGLPKAAYVLHSRYLLIFASTYYFLGLRESDVIYNSLPLYHIAGVVVGTACALNKNIPSVIKAKFSVTHFWTDCIKYNCTVAQYIGEMCRYLLTVPPRPEDKAHSIRLMVGNGMKPQIWKNFVDRFNIEQINEIYGSSEGNANIINIDNRIGAVGFIPSLVPKRFHPVAILRINSETSEPVRGPNGFCIRAEINEPGMFIGLINQADATREFHGYLDKTASKSKVIENVFVKGDKAFLTGDILVQDEFGYLYFKDRTGDTFRWKGENVATAEIEGVISNIVGKDTAVYGVEIPGMEGRAGMAAIVDPDNVLNLKDLAKSFDKALPVYARPIFLRIVKNLEMTSTFKFKKMNLQREGFDPHKIQDLMYFRSGNKEYVELTPEIYQEIVSGSVKI